MTQRWSHTQGEDNHVKRGIECSDIGTSQRSRTFERHWDHWCQSVRGSFAQWRWKSHIGKVQLLMPLGFSASDSVLSVTALRIHSYPFSSLTAKSHCSLCWFSGALPAAFIVPLGFSEGLYRFDLVSTKCLQSLLIITASHYQLMLTITGQRCWSLLVSSARLWNSAGIASSQCVQIFVTWPVLPIFLRWGSWVDL